ncbi:sodium-dependent multivitamin transporter, putative [Ixodes scapularis]|uniref:Sodium-dependent multivitamin transporter, putative n=1 Tax=Ixodes scapularis TaxID=6945 RepID=B7PC63_IXOSC|nr:sodium-dependent multivitamin transporter, putative [Ixodes scapularis]|eukprot:XP_002409443.1 sodium-dependent multivitamin transporter, putative [Ixodes scapularis]
MTLNLVIGLYFALSGRSHRMGADEAFLAGRDIGVNPLAVSVLASLLSATSVIGLTAHFYTYGLHMLWASVTALTLVPFIRNVIIPLIHELKVTSVFERAQVDEMQAWSLIA